MAGRRGRRGSGSTEQSSTEGAPTSDSGRPAALPQEVGAHIPVADEASKPAGILTVWSYLRQEGEAALAHLRALSGAKSPAQLMELQASEMARALGAALNLGQDLTKSAGLVAK